VEVRVITCQPALDLPRQRRDARARRRAVAAQLLGRDGQQRARGGAQPHRRAHRRKAGQELVRLRARPPRRVTSTRLFQPLAYKSRRGLLYMFTARSLHGLESPTCAASTQDQPIA